MQRRKQRLVPVSYESLDLYSSSVDHVCLLTILLSKSRDVELLIAGDIDQWKSFDLARRLDLRLEPLAQRDFLQRIDGESVSCEHFIENFERPLKPVVITNITNSWPAKDRWTIDALPKHYRNERFKCGEDDFGFNVMMKMKYFIHYMRSNSDDSPLYIFDGSFGEVSGFSYNLESFM